MFVTGFSNSSPQSFSNIIPCMGIVVARTCMDSCTGSVFQQKDTKKEKSADYLNIVKSIFKMYVYISLGATLGGMTSG